MRVTRPSGWGRGGGAFTTWRYHCAPRGTVVCGGHFLRRNPQHAHHQNKTSSLAGGLRRTTLLEEYPCTPPPTCMATHYDALRCVVPPLGSCQASLNMSIRFFALRHILALGCNNQPHRSFAPPCQATMARAQAMVCITSNHGMVLRISITRLRRSVFWARSCVWLGL